MDLISLYHVTLGYEKKEVVKELTFSIKEGDFLTILGPNGSGKSTLVKTILGLIPPLKGQIKYESSLKKNFIGYMMQEANVEKNFPASVKEIVLSGNLNRLGLRPFYGKQEKKRVEEALKLLGITNLKNKSFSDLSGGERQKVLLARSICATEKLLILDEPSNNLDYKAKEDLYQKLNILNKDKKITIIIITHDLDHGAKLGNKVLILGGKEIVFKNTKEYKESLD